MSTGCQWRALPKDLPPKSTVHDDLILWSRDGTLDRIHHALYVACCEQAEREVSPTAAIIDSQSVKSVEKGGPCIDPPGYDAGVKGEKRHVLVNTLGFLLHSIVHPADIQDRDGGILLLATLFGMYPFLHTWFTDAGYQGRQFWSLTARRDPRESTIRYHQPLRPMRPRERGTFCFGRLQI